MLLALLPSYLIKFSLLGMPSTLLEVMVLVLFGVFVIKRWKDHRRVSFSSYKWLILLLIIIATAAAVWSPNRTAALGYWKAFFVEPIMFFLVVINCCREKNDFNKIFLGLGISALAVSAVAIFQKFTGLFIANEYWAAEATRRVVSVYGFPNGVGMFLAPITTLFVGRIIISRYKEKKDFWWLLFNGLVVICSSLAIYWAHSEGAMVAVAIGTLLIGLLIKRTRIIAMIGSGIMVLIGIFVPAIRELIISKATLSDFSGNIRLIIWRETIQMLKDHPLLGGGLANYKAAIAPYHHALKIFEVYPHAHQFLLILWSELGVGGVMVFLLISLKKVFDYWHIRLRENKELYLILLISFVAMWIHGLVDSPYFKYDLSFLWWTMIALGVVTIRSKEKLFD